MGKQEFKNMIFNIFDRHFSPAEKYKLFLFGGSILGDNVENESLDIGIDAGEKLDLKRLSIIQGELDVLPSFRKIYLIDFYRISGSLRDIAIKSAEVLN